MTDSSTPRRTEQRPRKQGLGTFGGVFTPSILTILGIILFLRHGWVVGMSGLLGALAMIVIAHALAVITALSLAAIATNRQVRGGGDYYLISRSLGPEFGGALGLILFVAQSISVGFYCLGFGEAAAALLTDVAWARPATLALLAAGILFVIALVGSDLATRFQFIIMTIMAAALVSFVVGAAGRADSETLLSNLAAPAEGLPFWVVFAIFFPAVTGFTQGVSMSGDLARPRESLPAGTFAAIGMSLVVYTGAAILFAAGASHQELTSDFEAFRRFSQWAPLFDAGVIAATLSSALASFLGAPRILQALAKDRIFPWLNPFAIGAGGADNPRRAVLLTGSIVLVIFLLGDLNAIARIISMFFLVSYGLLNWATYVEAHGASPSFRPKFRYFHTNLALLGSLLCLGTMLAIDIWSGVIAVAVMAAIHQYLRNCDLSAEWADSRPAYNYRKLKDTIHEIGRLPVSEWSWQPNLLIFGENADRRDLLARFGTAFAGSSGIATNVGIVQGEGDFFNTQERRDALAEELREEIESRQLDAFPLAIAAPDLRVAVSTLLQAWGIGPVRANTVVLDWWEHLPDDSPSADAARYGRQLQAVLRMGCHVLVLDVTGKEYRDIMSCDPKQRRIDVWWWEESSCRLSLLLAYLMTRAPEWEDSTIRILVPCAPDQDQKIESHLEGLIEKARIDAEIEMVPDADSGDLVARSRDASLVFFRVNFDGMCAVDPFGGPLEDALPELPISCIVGAAKSVKLTEPEEPQPQRDDTQE